MHTAARPERSKQAVLWGYKHVGYKLGSKKDSRQAQTLEPLKFMEILKVNVCHTFSTTVLNAERFNFQPLLAAFDTIVICSVAGYGASRAVVACSDTASARSSDLTVFQQCSTHAPHNSRNSTGRVAADSHDSANLPSENNHHLTVGRQMSSLTALTTILLIYNPKLRTTPASCNDFCNCTRQNCPSCLPHFPRRSRREAPFVTGRWLPRAGSARCGRRAPLYFSTE